MAQGFFFTGDEGNLSTRRKLYEMMQRQGTSTEPIKHWTQGLARALTGVTGVLGMDKADAEQKRVDQEAMSGILGTMSRPDTVTGSTGMEATAQPASVAPTQAAGSPSQREIEAARFYQQNGLPPVAAAALAGNQSWESGGLNVNARNPRDGRDGSDSIGISQWNGPRAQALQQFARARGTSPTDFQTQLAFTMHELGTSERGAGQALRSASDPQSAAAAAIGYFRPRGWTPNNPTGGMHFNERVQRMQRILPNLTQQQAAAAVRQQDTLMGGDGMDEPAAPITSDTFPLGGRPGLPAPDLQGAFEDVGRTTPNGLNPSARIALMQGAPRMAPSVDDMMAGQQVVQPMQAPMPQPRPEMPQAPMTAPMPVARPNMEPPAGAQQASARQDVSRMMGLSERDRLMMLRDEQSLAPGEAQTLRAGLGGQAAPQAIPPASAPIAPQANPFDRLRQMVMGGGSTPAAPSAPAQAQSQPTASAAAPAAGGDARARLMQVLMSPNVSPTVRQAAMMAYQSADPTKREAADLANQAARLGIQLTQRQLAAPMPNSPDALAAQTRAREAEADRLGIQGQARQRYVLTGALPDQQSESIPAQIRTREQEAQRLGLRPGTPEYQNYALTGRFRDSPELSTTDRKAIMEAEEQVPIIQNTLTALNRALELNPRAYSGMGAGVLGTLGTAGIPGSSAILDPERAKATREFNQLMSGQAIEAMSSTLKGATTDREMAQFVEILGNPATPPEIRERTINRLKALAERQLQIQQARVQQLRGRDYFRPGGGQPGATPPAPAAPPPAAGGAQPPAPAIEMLRGNPTPTARQQFDQVFGAGAAERALGGR